VRRLVGGFALTVLTLALLGSIATASPSLSPGPAIDLRHAVMLAFFGETTDSAASFAAARGDWASESPLRDLALRPGATSRTISFAPGTAAVPRFAFAIGKNAAVLQSGGFDFAQSIRSTLIPDNVRFATPSSDRNGTRVSAADAVRASSVAAYATGKYQPVDPVSVTSPQPGALSFGPFPHVGPGLAQPASAFNASEALPGAAGSTVTVPSTLRVGPVQFTTRVEGASLQESQVALHDSAYGAGANFDVRAGRRNVNVDVTSSYEHLLHDDATAFSAPALGASSSWQLPGSTVPLAVPNFADMSKLSVGAALAVPVVDGLTLNLNYAAARMFGGYGMPGLANLDATNNSYGGRLTFAIPHSTGTLSISAGQTRYQDNILPANTSTQTHEDVNFTVKF
jgi:hypothetical protein